MRKALIAVIVASALFAVGAFAAEMTVQSDNVASGESAVTKCGDATVEWVISEVRDTATGDWLVTGATVTFDNADCDGAEVDLAIGLDTDATAGADTWIQANDCAGTANPYTCTPDAQPRVTQVVDVAVVANGNSVAAATAA